MLRDLPPGRKWAAASARGRGAGASGALHGRSERGRRHSCPTRKTLQVGPSWRTGLEGRSREPAASGRADPAEARLSAAHTALLQGYRRSVPSCSTGPERPPWPSKRNSRDWGREGAELGQQRMEAPEGSGEPRADRHLHTGGSRGPQRGVRPQGEWGHKAASGAMRSSLARTPQWKAGL